MNIQTFNRDHCLSFYRVAFVALSLAFGISANAADVTKDVINGYNGTLEGSAHYTLAGGGHSGAVGDYGMDLPVAGGWITADGTFLNTATTNDQITIAFWAKHHDTTLNSAFKVVSPSAVTGERGLECHLPVDNVIYFDTSGCCGSAFRLSRDISLFPDYTGSDDWWKTNWHFYVFLVNSGHKEIWIDGKLFVDGDGFAPLKTDLTTLVMGNIEIVPGRPLHAIVDDFAFFSTALTENDITNLFAGTLPTSLPGGTGLMAYWNFNDIPSNGIFQVVLPTPDTTNAAPDLVQVVHQDGTVPWTSGNVSLKIDDAPVTPTFTKTGDVATVTYVPNPSFNSGSAHTAVLTYPGSGGASNLTWQFTVGVYVKDVVSNRVAVIQGNAVQSAAGGGHTGAAGDYAMNLPNTRGYLTINGSFLNAASANDKISFAFWAKNNIGGSVDVNSAFWVVSASAPQQRGMEAHVPVQNDIYYDTSGYTGSQFRLVANITTFSGYTGNDLWWTTNWHFYVFTKSNDVKQIWIDGTLFTQGSGAVPLYTDFSTLYFGTGHGDTLRGLVDDFSIYSTPLTDTQIASLYSGTLPTALAGSPGLMAYWNFNDVPLNGIFQSIIPTSGATNAAPDLVQVVHIDGAALWTSGNVSLQIDSVTVPATFTKTNDQATVSYVPNPLFASGSTHTATLLYPGPGGTQSNLTWQFTVDIYGIVTRDIVASRLGYLRGNAIWGAGGSGHTGAGGDFAMNLPPSGGWISADAAFMNPSGANDELSLAFWAKSYDGGSYAINSGFQVFSPSSPQERGLESHLPVENDIYFDTSGYTGAPYRISANISTFPGYTGNDGWWTNGWHFYVFLKNDDLKQIWIDGILFKQGTGAAPLFSDFTKMYFGNGHGGPFHGLVDDFSIYSTALTGPTITNLYTGTLPTALPGSTGLIAYWNFNDSPPALNITRLSDTMVRITFEGTLESKTTINGTWTSLGVTSPYDVLTSSGPVFYRAKR
jgi:hypothetical protein